MAFECNGGEAMNRKRREEIGDFQYRLEDFVREVEVVLAAEQEYFDNMPESFQYGAKGEAALIAIENLESAIGALGDANFALSEAAE